MRMTVKDLIAELQSFHPDEQVKVNVNIHDFENDHDETQGTYLQPGALREEGGDATISVDAPIY